MLFPRRVTRLDSVAVIMECVLFPRKRVIGCMAEKAKNGRWRIGAPEHISQKTYTELFSSKGRADFVSHARRQYVYCCFCFFQQKRMQ